MMLILTETYTYKVAYRSIYARLRFTIPVYIQDGIA
jgi:hypothetical protein